MKKNTQLIIAAIAVAVVGIWFYQTGLLTQKISGVQFDSGSYVEGYESPIEGKHTISGENRVLFAVIEDVDNTMKGVTYAGHSLSRVGEIIDVGGGYTSLWVLINPPLGEHPLVATKTHGTQVLKMASVSYSGSRQHSQPDNFIQALVPGPEGLTMSIDPKTPGSWVVLGVHGSGPKDTLFPHFTTVKRTPDENTGFFDANGPRSTRTTLSVTQPHPDTWGGFIFTVAPAN